MIEVTVRLFATLRRYQACEDLQELTVAVPESTTLTDLLAQLGVPEKEVKTIFVNNRRRQWDYRLTHNDQVGIFPPIAGG